MSQSLAAECRLVVSKFLEACKPALSFTPSLAAATVSEGPGGRASVRVTFSRPSAAHPAPAAVIHVRFVLSEALDSVWGFAIEEDPHVWPTADAAFNDRVLNRVLERKLRLRDRQLVDLFDDFASSRLPEAIRAKQHRERTHAREVVEERLLDRLQRRDPYNDGRLSLVELAAAARELEDELGSLPPEVMLALAPTADRDVLIEYAPLVPLAAEAADAWAGWDYYREPDATADDKTAVKESDADEACAVAAFDDASKWQTRLLEDKLRQLLEAAGSPVADEHQEEPMDEHEHEDKEDVDADEQPDEQPDEHEHEQQAPRRPLVVSLRGLRAALESPMLLLSVSETNLVVALAVESSSSSSTKENEGEDQVLAVAALPALVSSARRVLFRFQRRSFQAGDGPEDALEAYLLRQFEVFERDTLKGSAQHLSGALSLKQAKRVVFDELPRLTLTLLQAAQCAAICDARRHPRDGRVRYRECVPEMAAWLRRDVDAGRLEAAARSLTELVDGDQHVNDTAVVAMRSLTSWEPEDKVRATSLRVFRELDDKQLGVVPLDSLSDALVALARELALPVDREDEWRVLAAAADPTGAGRVNYAAFQLRVLPLALAMAQRRVEALGMSDTKADAKTDAKD